MPKVVTRSRLLFTFLLIAASGAVLIVALRWDFGRPGALERPATVLIEHGTRLPAVARQLAGAGAVRRSWRFVVERRLFASPKPLQAGEYALQPGQSAAAIVAQMQDGRTVVHRLTVPEGWSVAETVDLIAKADTLNGPVPALPAEGRLLPETYFYRYGETRAALVERMQRGMDQLLGEVWAARDRDLPLHSADELLVLASLVEKETALAEERPRVAAVFINRLKRGMRLQSDPSVIYALTRGAAPLGRAVTHADLMRDDPINTYVHIGLPPQPIANPGRAALEAAAHPSASGALYFVADGLGGHVFSATLEEHNRHVAAWLHSQRPDQPQ